MTEPTPDQRRHNAAMRVIDGVCDEQEREYCRAVPQAAYAVVEAMDWFWNGHDYVRMPEPDEEEWP